MPCSNAEEGVPHASWSGESKLKDRELWRLSRKQAEKEGKRILGKGSKVFRGPEA